MPHRADMPRKRLIVSALLMAMSAAVTAQTAQTTDNPQDARSGRADKATEQPAQTTSTTPAPAKKRPANTGISPTPGNVDARHPTDLQAVQVTGIRQSLESSMNIKRDSQGIVDGIVAEDIGKFPDTNLAESLQRISGVSIDRVNGEGSRVTVRGIGPEFNLVLLNGRQMPTANIADAGASGSRAFDFANISSDAISEVDVYKTSRASTPEGGIGATINIKTARPLDRPSLHGNLGIKGDYDTSQNNIPNSLRNKKVTPELSGIFSDTFDDGKFGIGLSGSYQARDYGVANANVANGWHTFKGDENNWGTIPQPGAPGSQNITNRPGPNDTYSIPQNLNYNVSGIKRERTNGQLVLQYAPIKDLTTTLDYTYSDNRVQAQRNESSVWFNYGPSMSSWTDGPIAAPLVYSETIPSNPDGTLNPNGTYSDSAYGGGKNATRNTNKSLGFNVAWRVNENLNLGFDIHHSTATAGADSPYGSSGVLGTAGFYRGTTTADFTHDIPVVNVQFPPGQNGPDPSQVLVTGSSFRNSYQASTVNQIQATGDFTFQDYSRLDFGVGSTEFENRTAYSNVQLDTWGGATSPADYPDSVWHPGDLRSYFDQFSGHNDPNFTSQFFTWNFNQVRQLAEDAWVRAGNDPADYRASPDFTTDQHVREKSYNAFLQWSQTYNIGIPFNIAAGVRYEKTDVNSRALVPIGTGVSWGSENELTLLQGGQGFTKLSGSYKYVLPSIDLSLDLTDDMKLRGSYGETIGRPGLNDIQGGETLNTLVRVDGGTGQSGNPALKPLLSHNFDLSWEWYYAQGSYASVGLFRKNIDNYVGTSQNNESPFEVHTPVGGAYYNEAVAASCANQDLNCVRNYIFANHNGDPGVTQTGVNTQGNLTGTIVGQPGDPITNFRITSPANQRSASLYGWEFNLQQLIWNTGFGFSSNYTIVKSNLTYDNYAIGQQFALEGLSNSANLVAFYEKGPWQARAAYNWRGQFLSGRFDGAGPNPNYTEPYGQLDMTVSYQFNDHLSATLEGINVTNQVQRIHGRSNNVFLYGTQTGPRYLLGVRYKF